MSKKRQRFFIYERREIVLLVLLAGVVAGFAFTLGVHLGKDLNDSTALQAKDEEHGIETQSDKMPSRFQLSDRVKVEDEQTDELLNESVHKEVTATGIRLEKPRQTTLPTEVKKSTPDSHSSEPPKTEEVKHINESQLLSEKAPEKPFTLQIGSFPSPEDAGIRKAAIQEMGLNPFVRKAKINGKY